jgi:hypothetical protein
MDWTCGIEAFTNVGYSQWMEMWINPEHSRVFCFMKGLCQAHPENEESALYCVGFLRRAGGRGHPRLTEGFFKSGVAEQ